MIAGALLIAGLFFVLKSADSVSSFSNSTSNLAKPSQMNFSASNQLQNQLQTVQQPSPASLNESVKEGKAEIFEAVRKLQGEDKAKWFVFESIFNSKNDNDPRLDSELKKLSVPLHEALYEKYDSLQPENHSGKALIAYLIARDLTTTSDTQFLKKVFQESPCLSLQDCNSRASENSHHSGVEQTTLIIVQLNVLYSLEQKILANPRILEDSAQRSRMIQILMEAENFPVAAVHEKARAIRTQFHL